MSLLDLSNELLQKIAKHTKTDRDLLNYVNCCAKVKICVGGPGSSIWTYWFRRNFDVPNGLSSQRAYDLWRALYLCEDKEIFKQGRNTLERIKLCPSVFIFLMNNAFSAVPKGEKSKNIEFLRRAMFRSKLLEDIFMPRRDQSRRVQVMQLAMFYLALDQGRYHRTHCWEDSQRIVYSSQRKYPLFKGRYGQILSIKTALHIANFFKDFLTDSITGEMHQSWLKLPRLYGPRAFDAPLYPGVTRLGRKWKGTYTYLKDFKEIMQIRKLPFENRQHIYDLFDADHTDDGFFDMTLSFDKDHMPVDDFPAGIAKELDPYRSPKKLKAWFEQDENPKAPVSPTEGKDFMRFVSACEDTKDYLGYGTVSALPVQEHINGFQRFTMMKYVDPNDLGAASNMHLNGILANSDATRRARREHKDDFDLEADIDEAYKREIDLAREDVRKVEADFLNEPGSPSDGDDIRIYRGVKGKVLDEFEETIKSSTRPGELSPGISPRTFELISKRIREGTEIHKLRIEELRRARHVARERPYNKPVLKDDVDSEGQDVWLYEGVVLPGGKLIVGRWWQAGEIDDEKYDYFQGRQLRKMDTTMRCTGPFIYWCTDN